MIFGEIHGQLGEESEACHAVTDAEDEKQAVKRAQLERTQARVVFKLSRQFIDAALVGYLHVARLHAFSYPGVNHNEQPLTE